VFREGEGEVVLGTVGPREFAGETGVVEGRPCSATVSARTRPAQLEREHGRR
jgi:CRP-like cAMP-binding protein